MSRRKSLWVGMLVALSLSSPLVTAAQLLRNHAVETVGPGALADPLIAVEANRAAIVNRLASVFGEAAARAGVNEETLRGVLGALRADQLLAASLVGSFAELTAIVVQTPGDGTLLQRYVALTPLVPQTLSMLPMAQAYLTREGDTLTVTRAQELRLGEATVVGYFVSTPVSGGSVLITPKDGPGSGANSWIGYTAGNNVASGSGSAVAAGTFNAATGTSAMVVGGSNNTADGISALVIGGFDNRATVIDAMVGAGAGNRATGARSVVVGGGYNLASGHGSFIGGGGRIGIASTPAGTDPEDNVASSSRSVVTGGTGNRATGFFNTVSGGLENAASGNNSATVGGGNANTASGSNSTVGGGQSNSASGLSSTVGGGESNVANNSNSTVGGGQSNVASGIGSTIGGGESNVASGGHATIGGGFDNVANASFGTVGGGIQNTASGAHATVVGGDRNDAAGDFSVAMGRRAKALGDGAFAFADSSNFDFGTTTANAFRVRATGGVRFVTGIDGTGATTWSCLASDGTGWGCSSDRNLKQNLLQLDGQAVLDKLSAMPIYQWQPKGKNAHVKHFGPMAQDFHAAFGLGDDDKMIGMQDADGVALAAIQGLNARLEAEAVALRREIAELRERVASAELVRSDVAALKAMLAELQRERAALASR